jgi:D-3-phosphoglycerate dehydrogenase / 2-oxoglutarate reductase
MSKPIVVVSSPMNSVGVELLRQHYDVREVFYGEAPPQEIANALRDAEGVVTRSLPLTRALIEQSKSLKVVAKHGAGVDTIDVAAATEAGIIVANSGDANALGVAEHAVVLMLSTLRRVPATDRMVREGGGFAERERMVFGDLWDATVGFVGFGNIGRNAARMVRNGFQAKILAFDPAVGADAMKAEGAEKVDTLQALLERSDIVSLHLPLSEKTRHIIGRRELLAMKKHAILVNTSRGGTVDEHALHDALREGVIAGAGLDVFETEPPGTANPLFASSNVVLSPHIGGATLAARTRTSRRAAEAVIAVLSGSRPDYPINPEVYSRARAQTE